MRALLYGLTTAVLVFFLLWLGRLVGVQLDDGDIVVASVVAALIAITRYECYERCREHG